MLTHRASFYTEEHLHTASSYIEKLLRTEAFTHSKLLHTASFHTEKLLHREAFTQSKLLHTAKFYTEKLHIKLLHKEKLLHREVFAQSKLWHREAFTQQAFTQRSCYTGCAKIEKYLLPKHHSQPSCHYILQFTILSCKRH